MRYKVDRRCLNFKLVEEGHCENWEQVFKHTLKFIKEYEKELSVRFRRKPDGKIKNFAKSRYSAIATIRYFMELLTEKYDKKFLVKNGKPR